MSLMVPFPGQLPPKLWVLSQKEKRILRRNISCHRISDSSLTVELIRLFIATIVPPHMRNASHPLMEPWRMTPPCPRENQGGFL